MTDRGVANNRNLQYTLTIKPPSFRCRMTEWGLWAVRSLAIGGRPRGDFRIDLARDAATPTRFF
jgi:hypothetical protein